MKLEGKIKRIIKNKVKGAGTETEYREPLVGFASVNDPLFDRMKEVIGKHIIHPSEMLPEAKTVVAFFLPFAEDVVRANRRERGVAREWAQAYVETNGLIMEVCRELRRELTADGIKVFYEKPTHNFNVRDLTAGWSHKSVAYVAGLGTFGVHRMLITREGCAGRFGSIIISAEISPTPRPQEEFCNECLFCVNNCPIGALKKDGLDKKSCYQRLLEIDAEYSELGPSDVCGKCAVGPCSLKAP